MMRLAGVYVSDRAAAEEVVQDTWLGVLRGLDRFQARSSLKTWIFHILVNRAKTCAVHEGRSIPFSSMHGSDVDLTEPAVEPDRFFPSGHECAGHWAIPLQSWNKTPEELLLSAETRSLIEDTIMTLSPGQREVITLRDIEGWTAEEVCNVLGITETNQRVLLHRARSRVRRALERYFDTGEGSTR